MAGTMTHGIYLGLGLVFGSPPQYKLYFYYKYVNNDNNSSSGSKIKEGMVGLILGFWSKPWSLGLSPDPGRNQHGSGGNREPPGFSIRRQ